MKPDFSLNQIALLLRQTAFNAQPGTPDLAQDVLKQLASLPGLADLVKESLDVLQAVREPVAAVAQPEPVPDKRRGPVGHHRWTPSGLRP